MAAISAINNGEAMSSVRSKLNNVITEINLLDPTDWIDYSATSTIVGWSSFTTKIIRYRVIGKQIFVQFQLDGTSNSTSLTFTLPSNILTPMYNNCYAVDNGVANVGMCINFSGGTNVITGYRFNTATSLTSTWTASGTKTYKGQFFYEIA